MAQGNPPIYSIQRTYILKPVLTPENKIMTCDERIDIPTIEPLTSVKPLFYQEQPLTVIPCIELAGEFLSEFNLTFETNEGETVLPIVLDPRVNPLQNPYVNSKYVLVLPRGATGVKSCKLIQKATHKEVQHNLTFGVMPPPYNYDNALFGYLSYQTKVNYDNIINLESKVNTLKLKTKPTFYAPIELPKNAGKQTINIEDGVLFYDVEFRYPSSTETTIHKPKIVLRGDSFDRVYTLSLDRTSSNALIDLFTRTITVYDKNTGEIMKQLKISLTLQGYETLSFENFDDIDFSSLPILSMGVRVE